MTHGTMLEPGAGRPIVGGGLNATLKIAGGSDAITSTFEVIVPPGYDVGAHYHTHGEELFYVVSGQVELFAFEPAIRSKTHWSMWVSRDGRSPLHAGPGSLMHVPAGCPHAFRNTTDEPAVMLFQAAPAGHEDYFEELAKLMAGSRGQLDPDEVAKLRLRHDVHQITTLASPN
ncbi:cupin domain-containing protein [Streptomyces luteolifulvus]|uniref:Cupin domain-containing protein n=1 Tax=Streptomyces luteolifulvus TaxID=2615112 RepID=A0A6H9UP21_9ACTN|nr:cupin domain-containing protein [Streptomyces luteolifulvus]KAB1139650.1 cupin domain-containing protein [Streptomyces luteolifulvus]